MSFAEVVCSIGIVASVLVVLIGVLTGGLQALQKGTGYSHATIIASRTIEQYKTMEYTAIPLYDPNSPDIFAEDGFVVTASVTEPTYPSTSLNYKKVTVKVTKGEAGMRSKSIKVIMETMLINRD